MKGILDKLDFIQTKNFCSKQYNGKRMGKEATDWKKIFAKYNLIQD
jgi:hypothetical protein